MVKNVIEDAIIPESPKVLPNEQLHVYVPVASNEQKGVAKYYEGHFDVDPNGEVRIKDKIPIIKDETLAEKFLYSYFYTNEGVAKILKADSELDSDIAIRLPDGHLRVPYDPVSKNDVNVAISAKYVHDTFADKTSVGTAISESESKLTRKDISSFKIDNVKDGNGNNIFGVYNFKVTLGDGTVFSQQLDLPFEAIQLASVDDYVGEDGKRYLKIHFSDENIEPLNVELNDIFEGVDNLINGKLDKVTGELADYVRFYSVSTKGEQTVTKGSRYAGDGQVKLADKNGHIRLPNHSTLPPDDDNFAVSKGYCDSRYTQLKPYSNYTACVTVSPDGTQGTSAPYSGGAIDGFLVCRRSGAQILAPNQMSKVPGDDDYVSRRWVENRVSALEHDLIDFDESTVTASRRTTPLTAASTAYLTALHGKAVHGKNMFDPREFGHGSTIDSDGTISFYRDFEYDELYSMWLTLPAGTWTITVYNSTEDAPNGKPYTPFGMSFMSTGQGETITNNASTVILDKPTQVQLDYGMWADKYWCKFKVMLNEGDTALPYEPYGYYPTVVTAVKSYSANLIPFPYKSWNGTYNVGAVITHKGITYTVREDRSVRLQGTVDASDPSYMVLAVDLYLGPSAIGGGGPTAQATNNQYSISSRLFWGTNGALSISCATTGYYDDIVYPMANRGSRLLPYVPYFEPITRNLPTCLKKLPDFGLSMPDGSEANVLDLESKMYWHRCTKVGLEIKTTGDAAAPLSEYLTAEEISSLGDHIRIQVQGGGDIEFLGYVGSPTGSNAPVEIGTTMNFLLK